jgi:dihydrofolate reductase
MRKIIVSMMISLDGFYEGSNQDISWHTVDDDFNMYSIKMMDELDTILFGRKTYELFENYWPIALKDPSTIKDDLVIAKWIDDANKIVISKTLDKVNWKNTTLIHDNIIEQISKLKNESGKNIVIYGSGSIVTELTNIGLIDEYRLMVSPTILGNGTSLFHDVDKQVSLNLIETQTFNSGNVLLRYQPK